MRISSRYPCLRPLTRFQFLEPEQSLTDRSCYCLVTKSCLTLCDPMNCSLPGSSVHGISQARTLEWNAISLSRGSFQHKDWNFISCLGRLILYHWATRKAKLCLQMAPTDDRSTGWGENNLVPRTSLSSFPVSYFFFTVLITIWYIIYLSVYSLLSL